LKKVSRINDLCFKKAFSTDGITDPLIGLAKDMLDIDIAELSFIQPYSISDFAAAVKKDGSVALQQTIKDISADIRIASAKANLVSELQVKRGSNFDARSLYYLASTFVANYNRNQNKYGDLGPVYGINILGFKMFRRNKSGEHDNRGIRRFDFWDRYDDAPFPIDFVVAYFEYTKTKFLTQNQEPILLARLFSR